MINRGLLSINYLELSKEVSYALRHAPWEYELEIDENGWVDTDQLLNALRENVKWAKIEEKDLEYMIKSSEKKRHEIISGKIRALYGHSKLNKIVKEVKEPPEFLFHGTARRYFNSIKEYGLVPKLRQYVHLYVDTETALQVGKRHDNQPILLQINAKEAWFNGFKFYQGNDKVWLADLIPNRYISKL